MGSVKAPFFHLGPLKDNIKFDSKDDYAHLVDTLKLLAENDD